MKKPTLKMVHSAPDSAALGKTRTSSKELAKITKSLKLTADECMSRSTELSASGFETLENFGPTMLQWAKAIRQEIDLNPLRAAHDLVLWQELAFSVIFQWQWAQFEYGAKRTNQFIAMSDRQRKTGERRREEINRILAGTSLTTQGQKVKLLIKRGVAYSERHIRRILKDIDIETKAKPTK